MTSEQRQQYIRTVIVAVYRKPPEEARVTSFDFGVIDSWMNRKDENGNPDPLPLATVLQTVEEMQQNRGALPPSIRYVRQAVEDEEFRRFRALT